MKTKPRPTDSGPLDKPITKLSRSQKAEVNQTVKQEPGVHRSTTLANRISGLNELDSTHTAAIADHLTDMVAKGKMKQDQGGNSGFKKA